MKQGDIVRSKYSSRALWKVMEVYPNEFMWAKCVTKYRRHKTGDQQMLRKEDYVIEEDPEAWAEKYDLVLKYNAPKKRP